MQFLASTISYTAAPTDRQAVVGAIVFLLTYLMPLGVLAFALHRLPSRWRMGIDSFLAVSFALLALAVPSGILAEGMALFFAVIAIASSIDMLRLGRVARGIGILTLLLSAGVVLSATGPAFVHALCSSHRY